MLQVHLRSLEVALRRDGVLARGRQFRRRPALSDRADVADEVQARRFGASPAQPHIGCGLAEPDLSRQFAEWIRGAVDDVGIARTGRPVETERVVIEYHATAEAEASVERCPVEQQPLVVQLEPALV